MARPYNLIKYLLETENEYIFREVDSASRKVPKVFEPDSQKYFDWLKSLRSFRFVGQNGEFIARQETRTGEDGKRRDGYWTAYRKIQKRQFRKYLGTADKLRAHPQITPSSTPGV